MHRHQIGCTGDAIQKAEAVEHERRRKDAQQKVFRRRFLRIGVAPLEIEQHIGGNAHEFQREKQAHQVVCRRREIDAGCNQQQHRMPFAPMSVNPRMYQASWSNRNGPVDSSTSGVDESQSPVAIRNPIKARAPHRFRTPVGCVLPSSARKGPNRK
jgi:hypothetical protein